MAKKPTKNHVIHVIHHVIQNSMRIWTKLTYNFSALTSRLSPPVGGFSCCRCITRTDNATRIHYLANVDADIDCYSKGET